MRRRGDEELPPPPVSPPSYIGPAAHAPPPGYVSKSLREGENFRQANLPRRIPDNTQPTNFRLARPGERLPNGEEPPLYGIWDTSYKAMDEWGIGVGLYYRQLLLFGLVIMLCAVIYMPTMVHNAGFNGSSTPAILKGTAHNASRADLSLNLNGIPDLIVTLLLVLFALASRKAENVAVESIDTAQQTPQDYSVCIHNPPRAPGLSEPDTYHEQFRKYGEIAFITICLGNGDLLRMVAKKRVIEHQIHVLNARAKLAEMAGNEVEMRMANQTTAHLKAWQAWLQSKFGLFATKDYLDRSLKDTYKSLKGLSHRIYEPKRVYITFQTEQAQRKCLKAVETGLWEERLAKLRGKEVNEQAVIGGKVCRIDEAEEPSDVLWENMATSIFQRAASWALSGFLSIVFLSGSFFILKEIFESGLIAGIFVALVNALLPLVIRLLTLSIELHSSLTLMQASMMFKLVAARAINSAFLLFIITSDDEQLESHTLTKVLSILIADAFTGPLLRLANLSDLFGRKVIAPKAKTQAEMNVFFLGAPWHLAERYTDMIKTVLVGLFYSAIVPTGLIVTALAMMMTYWVDKYSLLRQWRRSPAYDARLSSYTRKYVAFCIWLHLVMARIFFAEWPSQSEEGLPDCGMFFCDQGEEEIFTDDQRRIVDIYEVLGLLVVAASGGLVLITYAQHYATKLVVTKHKAVGQASNIGYRSVSGIDAYIPLIHVRQLTDPLLGMDVNDLPSNAHPFLPLSIGGLYSPEELSMSSDRDFPGLSKRERDELFSKVRYYPGPGEKLQWATKNGGILYSASTADQSPAGARAFGLHHFGLARRFSIGSPSFIVPEGPVQESPVPQRSRLDESTTRAELPSGWEERIAANGRCYYVCHHTRITQWERPSTGVPTLSTSFGGAPDAGCVHDLHRALKDLPPGWELKYAPGGRPYYVDHNKGVTSWERPSPLGQLEREQRLAAGGATNSVEKAEEGTQFQELYTAAGLRYFLDPRTKVVVWSPPESRGRGRGTSSDAAGSATRSAGGDVDQSLSNTSRGGGEVEGLPPGWESRATATGRVYYVNHDLRITQWAPPGSTGEQKSPYSDTQQAASSPTAAVVPVGFGSAPAGQLLAPSAPGVLAGGEELASNSLNGLPGYIGIYTNTDERTYYVNHRTHVTSWVPPPKEDW